jgi:hypothetical protein
VAELCSSQHLRPLCKQKRLTCFRYILYNVGIKRRRKNIACRKHF